MNDPSALRARSFLCQSRGCICAVVTPNGTWPSRACDGCGKSNWRVDPDMSVEEWFAYCAEQRAVDATRREEG